MAPRRDPPGGARSRPYQMQTRPTSPASDRSAPSRDATRSACWAEARQGSRMSAARTMPRERDSDWHAKPAHGGAQRQPSRRVGSVAGTRRSPFRRDRARHRPELDLPAQQSPAISRGHCEHQCREGPLIRRAAPTAAPWVSGLAVASVVDGVPACLAPTIEVVAADEKTPAVALDGRRVVRNFWRWRVQRWRGDDAESFARRRWLQFTCAVCVARRHCRIFGLLDS